MVHKLKTWPCFFEEVFQGRKQFEIRKNDRDFKVGDTLLLEEYDIDSESYTGRHCHREVTYILTNDNPFLPLGDAVVMSIK